MHITGMSDIINFPSIDISIKLKKYNNVGSDRHTNTHTHANHHSSFNHATLSFFVVTDICVQLR